MFMQLNINKYTNNYNPIQLRLPLEVDTIIPSDDVLHSFVKLKRKVNLEKYIKRSRHRGNQGYDPTMMLDVILFAYSIQIFSLRKIEQACKTDIRFIYLANGITPSHNAFADFINKTLVCNMEDIFFDFTKAIVELDNVDTSILYIDGTKFEANATKNSFVWKKAVLKFQDKLYDKISELLIDINLNLKTNFTTKLSYNCEYLDMIENYLLKLIEDNKIEFVYGKGVKKTIYQKYYELINTYLIKLNEYTNHIEICGERNSYSKTDNGATFMNMKYDYYNQTGVFKAGYNIQIGVSDEYILVSDVFQNPTDIKTFIPMMNKYKDKYNSLPKYPVTDAGYGSYDNYSYCLDNNMELAMKYNYFDKVHYDKKFTKRKYNLMNFEKLDNGIRVCPAGNKFDKLINEYDSSTTVYKKTIKIYECGKCNDCDNKKECTKAANNRQITVCAKQDEMYKKADELLTSEIGVKLRKQRAVQVEGAFGVIKENYKYDRLHRRSIEKVRTEILLVSLGYNIKKYHNKKLRKKLS